VASRYEAKGLGPAAGWGWYTADKNEPICETMDRLGTLPFVAQPGEAFVYGYNTDILGCVVEKASGVPLDQFVRTRITEPLGLKDTRFFIPAAERDRLAAVYASGPEGKIVRAEEVVMIAKTRATMAESVCGAVKELHGYTTPAIMVLPVENVDPDYHAWILRETAQ
jgi:CubicO group peptidase (beta-lactamase class C family)